MPEALSDENLFMVCHSPRLEAYSTLPSGFSFDFCRRDELEIWKTFPFDEAKAAMDYREYMDTYFHQVYEQRESEFYSQCLFVRDTTGNPVATGFIWRAYGCISTLHWLKVKREYEDRGRQGNRQGTDYPVGKSASCIRFSCVFTYAAFQLSGH